MYASGVYSPHVRKVVRHHRQLILDQFCHHCRHPYPVRVILPTIHTHMRRLSSPYRCSCFACSGLRAMCQHITLFQEQREGDHRALLDSPSLLNHLPTPRPWTSVLPFLSPFPIYAMRGLGSFRPIFSRICKILGREGFTGGPWMLRLQNFE